MRILIACMTVALGAGALVAQGPGRHFEGRRGPGTDAIKSALTLSDEQVAALKENNKGLRESMKTVMEQAGEKHKAMQAELENANPNPTVVGQLMIDAKAIREQSSEVRAEYREKALAILNAEQQSALAALKDAEERSPALREAAMLNLVEIERGSFGKHGPHRGGFRGRS